MRSRLWRVLKWVLYPLFYVFCLLFFAYLSFPFEALKTRIVAEFDRMQARQTRRPGELPMRLSIGKLDGYWLSGLQVERVRLLIPPKPTSTGPSPAMAAALESVEEPAGPSTIEIESAHVRVRLLPLLTGTVKIDFFVKVFAGEVEGTLPYGAEGGDVDVELRGLQLAQVEPLRAMIKGMPLQGVATGSLHVTPVGGKFANANGTLDIRVSNITLGDGEAKLQGVALPPADGGQLALVASIKDGVLKLDELVAKGKHLEVEGDGTVRLRETWKKAKADVFIAFRFTDAYRDLDDTTRGLLGKPGDKFPPAIELGGRANPLKRAKRDDGFYQFQLLGYLDNLDVNPAATRTNDRRASGAPEVGTSRRKFPKLGSGANRSLRRPPSPGGDDPPAADPPDDPAPEEAPEPRDEPTPDDKDDSDGAGDE